MERQRKNKEVFDCSLLKDVLDSGIIIIDSVLDEFMSTKKEQVKKVHPYSITSPASKNGRWQTYYKSVDGKRKIVRAQTEDELLNKLVQLYFRNSYIDKMTFHELYEEWLDYKKSITNSPNTIKRHEQHYKKYFEISILNNKKVKEIDELLLEQECNRIVREFNLPRKEWSNAKTILNGMYSYAVRKKYLEINFMDKVQIFVKFKQVVRKTGKTETFNSDELKSLTEFLDRMYQESGDSSYMAVKLNFLLGLRVGELVALKWEDFSENHLHIVREEIRNQVTNEISVVEHTKTNKDRFVVLVPKAIAILNKLEHEGDYIFMKDGKRMTSIRIASVLRKYARYEGTKLKSSHKIRKTFASNLNAAGVPLDCIRELLGHSSLSTTLGYIYNPLTEAETYNLIEKAL